MRQELTGGWSRASQGLDVMAMDPLGQGYDSMQEVVCESYKNIIKFIKKE